MVVDHHAFKPNDSRIEPITPFLVRICTRDLAGGHDPVSGRPDVKVAHLEIDYYMARGKQEEVIIAAHDNCTAYEFWLAPAIRLKHRKRGAANSVGDSIALVGNMVRQHCRSKLVGDDVS